MQQGGVGRDSPTIGPTDGVFKSGGIRVRRSDSNEELPVSEPVQLTEGIMRISRSNSNPDLGTLGMQELAGTLWVSAMVDESPAPSEVGEVAAEIAQQAAGFKDPQALLKLALELARASGNTPLAAAGRKTRPQQVGFNLEVQPDAEPVPNWHEEVVEMVDASGNKHLVSVQRSWTISPYTANNIGVKSNASSTQGSRSYKLITHSPGGTASRDVLRQKKDTSSSMSGHGQGGAAEAQRKQVLLTGAAQSIPPSHESKINSPTWNTSNSNTTPSAKGGFTWFKVQNPAAQASDRR